MKKGQVGVEYLIMMGFITLAISGTLLLSEFYIGASQTTIRTNQVESFANKVIESSESVYYSGEPSKTTLDVFLPENVNNITIKNKNLIIEYTTSSGDSIRAFESNVPLNGSIETGRGIKKLKIEAKKDFVKISN